MRSRNFPHASRFALARGKGIKMLDVIITNLETIVQIRKIIRQVSLVDELDAVELMPLSLGETWGRWNAHLPAFEIVTKD
jgi:hypothetical protein